MGVTGCNERTAGVRAAARKIPALITGKVCAAAKALPQCLADFCADDACRLCGADTAGVEVGCGHTDGNAPSGHWIDILSGAVTVSIIGLRFENHPVCRACARGFVSARSMGVLGVVDSCGRVTTVSGDRFGAAGAAPPVPAAPPEGGERLIPVVAPFMTTDSVLKIVHLAKYRNVTSLLGIMARAMASSVRRSGVAPPAGTVLVPVPRFPGRKRHFDHTRRLASLLSGHLSLPVDSAGLRKIRDTASQSRTPRACRAQNVRTAFAASGFDGCHLLLVDDLVTTGATAAACAAAVMEAGASSITLLCFGRAL